MKFFYLLLFLFVVVINNVIAADPGSNYGCEADFNHSTYTNWVQTFTASPNDPGWQSTFQGYDEGGVVYAANYDPGEMPCGQANPNNFQSAGQVCWVYRSATSSWVQGALRTWEPGAVTPCPIDDYIPVIIVVIGGFGFFYLKTNMFSQI